MNISTKTAKASASAALGMILMLALAPQAHADVVPFSDPNSSGAIGFCDASGTAVTSGSLTDKPFVATAVSSAPAPAGYEVANKGKASLYAYLPIQSLDPGEWVGTQMTSASLFSANSHPMAQGTTLDESMGNYTTDFPPQWQGLVQLRMSYTAPNKSAYSGKYPTAVIKVTGTSWSLIEGGNPACSAGKATSIESIYLPSSSFNTTSPPASAQPGSPSASTSNTGGSDATARSKSTKAAGDSSASNSDGASATSAAGGAVSTPVPGPSGSSSTHAASAAATAASLPSSGSAGANAASLPNSQLASSTSHTTRNTLLTLAVVVVVAVGGAIGWWSLRAREQRSL